jgi:hypothetical protein
MTAEHVPSSKFGAELPEHLAHATLTARGERGDPSATEQAGIRPGAVHLEDVQAGSHASVRKYFRSSSNGIYDGWQNRYAGRRAV